MTQYVKDGVERVVSFASRPADIDAITVTEWSAATEISGGIVKPLDIDFDDPNTFPFNTIDKRGAGDRAGRDNYHGNVRVARDFDSADMQPDETSIFEITLALLAAKGEDLFIGVYRGPKLQSAGALVAGDEYDYFEFTGGRAKSVADEENYMAKDIVLRPTGECVSSGVLVAGA